MTRRAAILRLAVLAALMGAFVAFFLISGVTAGEIRDRVDDAGPAAPFVFILVSALLTVLFVPGPILAASSGLLFGVALGTPVAIVSATLGAVLAFSISRWWGHDAVEHLAGPRLKAIRDWIGERGFRSVFYARLTPGAPYSLVNYASGLAPVRLRDFALATAIGCSPRAFAYTALGGSLDNLDSPEAMVALGVLVLMALVGIVPLVQERRRRLPRTKPSGPGTDS
ncbi:MAG: TVP38/TMEM64 family protein [Actinomycetes bacterium]